MKIIWGFWVSFLFSISTFAQAVTPKPFYLLPPNQVAKVEGNQQAQTCFLRKNITAHLNYVTENVLLRGDREALVLVQPQIIEGQSVYIGHDLEYTDLYHFHLRYSTDFQSEQLAPFLDSSNYHLQYHAYEHFDLMLVKRLFEIRDLKDPVSQEWASERITKETTSSSSGAADAGAPAALKIYLDQAGIDHVVQVWHSALGVASPGEHYLSLWLHALNDRIKETKSVAELTRYRSVASFDDRFEIIPELDKPNVWQPVDVMFSRADKNQEIATLVRDFTARTGQKWVGNMTGKHKELFQLSPEVRADSLATFKKILALVAKDSDPMNTFKFTVLDSPVFTTAFAVSDNFVYSLKYNLPDKGCQ